jgi:hypothetical protein
MLSESETMGSFSTPHPSTNSVAVRSPYLEKISHKNLFTGSEFDEVASQPELNRVLMVICDDRDSKTRILRASQLILLE